MRCRFAILAAIPAAILGAAALGSGPAPAQQPPAPQAASPAPATPAAPFTLQYEKHLTIHPDLTVTEVLSRRVKILVPSVVQALSQEQLGYFDGMQTLDVVEAYTEKADGRRVPVDPATIITQDPVSGLALTFVRDLKQKVLIFPDVGVGDTLVETVKLETLKNLFPGQWIHSELFAHSLAYTSARVIVEAPAALDLELKLTGTGLTDSTEVSGDIRRHTITLAPQPYQPDEPGAVSPFDREPGIFISTFKSYAEFGKAYGDAALPQAAITPEIAALADEITANITDRRAQAAAIDAWMKKNIRYVAVYLALGRVVPHDAATVLANKFGDCKDKVTLMSALLSAKGIASEAVLIDLGPSYTLPEPPTMAVLNHAIIYLPDFDLYDDPTVNTAAFGVLAPEAYDKPVVRVSKAEAKLARTPPMRSEDHTAHAQTTISIAADGTVTGQTKETNTGVFGIALRATGGAVQAIGDATAATRALQGLNTPGNGRFSLGNIADTADPATVTGTFILNEHFKAPAAGSRVPISYGMALTARPGNFLLGARQSSRKSAFICYSGKQIEDIDVKIAPGLPLPVPLKANTIDQPAFSYHSTFSVVDRTLKVHREFISHVAGQVCPAELEARIAADMNTIRIEEYSAYAFAAPPPPPAPPPGTPQEAKRTFTVDRKAQLDFMPTLNPDCSSIGFATVHVVEEPQHGTMVADHGNAFATYAKDNPRFECNKRRTDGTVISYEPSAGFAGTDSITLEFILPSGTAFKRHYAITISPPPPPPTFEYKRVAAADQTLQLAYIPFLYPDCSSVGFADVHVLEGPQHGKASVEQGTGFSAFNQDNVRFYCNTRRTDGVNLSYVPEAGYTGTDSLTVEVLNPDGSSHKRHFAIEVK